MITPNELRAMATLPGQGIAVGLALQDAAIQIETFQAHATVRDRDPEGHAEISRANEIKRRYEKRCLDMAALLYAFVHGKRPDGSRLDYRTATAEAEKLISGMDTAATLRQRHLQAALVWARNHIDCGDPTLKPRVIERLDKIIDDGEPITGDAMRALAQAYPLER